MSAGGGLGRQAVEEGKRLIEQADHHRCGERFLGAEVLVEAGLGDPRLGCHLVHGHEVIALAGEHRPGGVEDGFLPHELLLLAHAELGVHTIWSFFELISSSCSLLRSGAYRYR